MRVKGKEQLQGFMDVMENLGNILDMDCMICVTDRERFLKYVPGKRLDVRVKAGDMIPAGDLFHKAMGENKRIVDMVPKQVYGISFKGVWTPVEDKIGNVIGCIGLGVALDKESRLEEMAAGLAATIEQVTASIDEISKNAQQIAADNEKLVAKTMIARESTEKTNNILDYIKKISDKTNLLGLNAAIEAARAGDHGRGFAVVADEIRKLSIETKKSVVSIGEILVSIRDSVSTILEAINKTSQATEEQAATIQQIEAAIEEISTTAQQLADVSDVRSK